jgi:hypothetical protein
MWSSKGAVLTRVDVVSRQALPNQPSVLLGYARYGPSTSPDGALLVTTSGVDRYVHLSDLAHLSGTWKIGPLPHAVGSPLKSAFWLARRTLAVSTGSAITLIDANARTVRKRIPVNGLIVAEAARAGRYVALVAREGILGTLHLVSLEASGRVVVRTVPALRGGRSFSNDGVMRSAVPGLALSPGGKLAYVVGRGNRIVAANFDTGRARVIVVRADRTLQAAAKGQAGWMRTSALLGSATLVTTGGDLTGREYSSFLGGRPAGLRITDLATRRTHVPMTGANQFRICGGLIVAARSTAEPAAAGVVALARTGRTLWSQYAGAGVLLAGCTQHYVYLQIPRSGVATLDTHTGAVLDAHRGSAATVIELT